MKDKLIKKVCQALNENNIEVEYFETGQAARDTVLREIPSGATIGLGGSTTMAEIGLRDAIRDGDYKLFDQYEPGISKEENIERRRAGLTAEYYLTGTNAVTEKGELVNIDGLGNRVAAIIFGPKKVFIVVSTSKIVKDIHDGLERIRKIAAPANARRFGRDLPCVRGESCEDCPPDQTLCNYITVVKRQPAKGRMKLFLIEGQLGF